MWTNHFTRLTGRENTTGRMNSMSSIFTLLLWFALTTYTCGIFYLKIPITMHPNENKEVAVNDTVIISCNVSSIQNLSLFINNTLVNSKNAAIIKYKFTSDKPNVYSFKCTSLKMEYFVKITFRIPPVVVSARAQIFSLNGQICHMVVNFTLQHFRKFDYIKISRSENGREMQLCSNNSVCQFKCLLFHLYAFNVQIITSNFPMYSENWEFRASKKFCKFLILFTFNIYLFF